MENKISDITLCTVCRSNATSLFTCKDGWNIHRCTACDLLFVWPLPSETLSEKIYSQDYFDGADGGFGYVDYDADKAAMRATFEKYLDYIEELCPEKGRLLDVGAATGYFMSLAAARGWDVYGIEISEFAAAQGRAKGLNVQAGTLDTIQFDEKFFSVVTYWDTIEHVRDPQSEMKKIFRVLAPDGLFACNTPDAGSVIAKIARSRWHLLTAPEHLNLFNIKNLRAMLKENGFGLVRFGKLGKNFTLQYIGQFITNTLGGRCGKIIGKILRTGPIGRISIPINLHDNLYAIARKCANQQQS